MARADMTPAMLAWVAVGSALGGAARFLVSDYIAWRLQERFPWGTLAVNLSGAAIIGFVLAIGLAASDRQLWALLGLGFLGSYTTVSAFALQALLLAEEGRWRAAGGYVVASALGCLAAVAAGFALGLVAGGAAVHG